MTRITPVLAAVALVFFAAQTASAAERQTRAAKSVKATQTNEVKVKARKALPDYQDVAGFTGRVDDPLHANAAEPAPSRMGPVITNFPMPHTVWW